MLIVGISASARVWGNCESAVKTFLLSASRSGATCEFIRLTDVRIEPCRGCFKCIPEGGRCPLDDDLYGLLEKISQADGRILAAPVYFMTPAAGLIALLDRLLTMGNARVRTKRRAVTVTIMGNSKWRGVAVPIVNVTASLLGFDLVESLEVEAQGPGEVLLDETNIARLTELGRLMAEGEHPGASTSVSLCPVCRSDFFRHEDGDLACPICGIRIKADRYLRNGVVARLQGEPRWSLDWLRRHIASWIKVSIEGYKTTRRRCLEAIKELKRAYDEEIGGS